MARLNPNNADVQFTLAVLLMGQKQPEAALTALEAAAQLRPRDQNIQELLIKALARLGRWEQVTDAALAQIKEYPGKAALALKLYPQLTKHRPQGAAILLEAALPWRRRGQGSQALRAPGGPGPRPGRHRPGHQDPGKWGPDPFRQSGDKAPPGRPLRSRRP